MEPAENAPVATGFRVVWAAATTLPTLLKKKSTMAEKLRMLSEWQSTVRDVAAELATLLDRVTDAEIAFDDDLKLLKAWERQEAGDEAGCYYYLHSLEFASDRIRLRNWMGLDTQWAAEQLVFLITVDCLRADRLSCNGHAVATTPSLDAFAAEGVNFQQAYATAGHTYLSFPGILLSTFYQNFGRNRVLPAHQTTLAEAMAEEGFHTAAFNAGNPLISRFYGYDRGFADFHDFLELEESDRRPDGFRVHTQLTTDEAEELQERIKADPQVFGLLDQLCRRRQSTIPDFLVKASQVFRVDAAEIVKHTIGSLLAGRDRAKQFHWLHLMDVHEDIAVPYSRLGTFKAPQQVLLNACTWFWEGREALGGFGDRYGELYDTAVSYVDMNLQVLLNVLTDTGLMDSSLVCVTADHGQELLERGTIGHGPTCLMPEVVHVPLVFGGGLADGITRPQPARAVSTLDLAPTILDVCGVPEAPASFLGTSLNDTSPRPVYGQSFYEGIANRSREDGIWWQCHTTPREGTVRDHCKALLFCIEDGHQLIHDTGTNESTLRCLQPEMVNIPPDKEELCGRMKDYFDQAYVVSDHVTVPEMSEPERELVEQRLRELGYL